MLVTARAGVAGPDGQATAVRDHGGDVSRAAFAERVRDVARAAGRLATIRDDPTPIVALSAEPSADLLATFLGLASAGWAVAMLDPEGTPAETRAAIAQLDPAAVVSRTPHIDTGGEWAPQNWPLPDWRLMTARRATGPGVQPPEPDSAFYVGLTSGSSDRPKAFIRSHRSWWESFERFSDCCPIDEDRPVVVPGPLSSSHFLFGALHALHRGARVDLLRPERLAARLASPDPIGALYVVPTMLARLAGAEATIAVTDWVFCAGAALPPDVRAWTTRSIPGGRLVEYYGASELSFVAIDTPDGDTPPGAVGRLFPGVEVSIRDDSDRPLPAGQAGWIFARSELVFAGYRGPVSGSAARQIAGGWWTVGDRGILDAKGFLTVEGRGSSLIITGGANVQPEEVEGVLTRHPDVAECVVVGIDDATWGQLVCAVLTPVTGATLTREVLRAHVSGHLARYKRPRRYLQAGTPLPLGRTGKVDRARVAQLVESGVGLREVT